VKTFPLSKVSDLPTHVTIAVLDTETTGLDIMHDRPFQLLLSLDGVRYAVPWSSGLVRWITDVLPKTERCIFHGAKYDLHMFVNGGVHRDVVYNLPTWCTLVGAAIHNEHRFTYNLDDLGTDLLGMGKRGDELYQWLADKFGGPPTAKAQMGKVEHAPPELVAYYGIGDIEVTEGLYGFQLKHMESELMDLMNNIEMPALKALLEMERRGVRIDEEKVDIVRKDFEKRQEIIQQTIFDIVGFHVNPRSPNDMIAAFEKLDIPIIRKKLTVAMKKKGYTEGNPTFAKDILESLSHPFIDALNTSRGIKTMLDTFINGSIAKAVNGKIHTTFNQTRTGDYGTGTGRLSSSDPNLQQVPKRDGELAPLVRGLFVPEPEHLWTRGDWEQFEFRIFAHFCRDSKLTERYQVHPDTDFHQALSEETGVIRDRAKRINLGLVFGMGEGKLAKEVGLPYTLETYTSRGEEKTYLEAGPEAKALFAGYHSRFPRAQQFLKQASNIAKTRGYVKTILGRHIRFPGGFAVHKAGGLVFQGSAADIMKQKLKVINDRYRKTDSLFTLAVHDEFCLSSPAELAPIVAKELKEIMEDVPEFRIPILADTGFGPNWWEVK